jgi:hypothetical protein
MRTFGVLVALALAACSSGNGNGDGGVGGTGGGGGGGGGADAGDCEAESTITVSGALTGTRSAPAPTASQGTANDVSSVNVSAQFGTPFLSVWSFTFTGAPGLTVYTEATSGLSCGASVTDPADLNRSWLASKGVSGTPDQGTCSITFTSVTPTLMLAGQTQYCVHGTVQATMPARPGSTATGTVTLSASF